MTLEDYLRQNAKQWPDKAAVICGDQQCTYAELDQRVDERAKT
jgi:non-ribosomal peptide synthetase component E (peptide arylation enzyme)